MGMEFVHLVEALGYEFASENFIAHFSYDEQASVRMVFQTHEHNIKEDFGIASNINIDNGVEVSIDDQLAAWAASIPSNV
jgi:hypothetical protein